MTERELLGANDSVMDYDIANGIYDDRELGLLAATSFGLIAIHEHSAQVAPLPGGLELKAVHAMTRDALGAPGFVAKAKE